MKDDIKTHAVASLFAGTAATTICAPADVLKSRIQSAAASGPGANSLLRIVQTGLREEGAIFLMKGWTPAWLRLTRVLVQAKHGPDFCLHGAAAATDPVAVRCSGRDDEGLMCPVLGSSRRRRRNSSRSSNSTGHILTFKPQTLSGWASSTSQSCSCLPRTAPRRRGRTRCRAG
ncbi:mitochondrial dicarboxylate transporter [Colletotrichum higginsianum]|uniref:Mitochondrial dicarboxylate transporter n=1 Tax=Colletotrichum higginsianum (strain IMI 349063) TaxID=759273 RepID=H1VL98_COLHI|nr:mitochondrial dicarboxylate transporter [Colletotrichum higginsianum]